MRDTEYRLLPAWSLRQAGPSLLISGGADATFEVDLEGRDDSFFSTLTRDSPFTRGALTLHDQRILDELVIAEIVAPVLQKAARLSIALLGDTEGPTPREGATLRVVPADQPHDLAVYLRSGSTYADFLARVKYADVSTPHLYVDLAYHHTVSVGPLVFPGETACIACLQGRVTTRWGDDAPPPSPKVVQDYTTLIAELVTSECVRIAEGDTTLTNKTVTWNLLDRTVTPNQLLKVPLCPVCSRNRIERPGSLDLPWAKR